MGCGGGEKRKQCEQTWNHTAAKVTASANSERVENLVVIKRGEGRATGKSPEPADKNVCATCSAGFPACGFWGHSCPQFQEPQAAPAFDHSGKFFALQMQLI